MSRAARDSAYSVHRTSDPVQPTFHYMVKFIIVGSMNTGKSALLVRFAENEFHEYMESTVGVDFNSKFLTVDGVRLKLQVWDTAGQEEFRSITQVYYRETAAALLVYDVSDRHSFDQLNFWLGSIRETDPQHRISIALVANKCDVDAGGGAPGQVRAVSSEEGRAFARAENLLFFETSAKTGANVVEAFSTASDAVLRKLRAGVLSLDDPASGVRAGNAPPPSEDRGGGGGGGMNFGTDEELSGGEGGGGGAGNASFASRGDVQLGHKDTRRKKKGGGCC